MKTASRENPNRTATLRRNRAHGVARQNRPCSVEWAAKQEKFQPKNMCFFLTSTFIELTSTPRPSAQNEETAQEAERMQGGDKPHDAKTSR
jgi:hypothetical protein